MIDSGFTDRLAKVLGRLGSDQPGEVANAARVADQMVRGAGTTWDELLVRPVPRTPLPIPRNGNIQATAAELLRHYRAGLNGWEVDFLANISTRTTPLSAKQISNVGRIYDRVSAIRGTA